MTLENESYILYLSSADKQSGTNNNANFNINFNSFLPNHKYKRYKLKYAFNCQPGYYKTTSTTGYANLRIECDFGVGLSYSSSNDAPSPIIGFADIVIISLTNNSNFYVGDSLRYYGKVINKPNQSNINIKIYNNYDDSLLVDTNSSGVLQGDMTAWNMVLEFIPISD